MTMPGQATEPFLANLGIIELSRRADSPAARTEKLVTAAERVRAIADWVRNTLGDSRWLYPDGTLPNGWEP